MRTVEYDPSMDRRPPAPLRARNADGHAIEIWRLRGDDPLLVQNAEPDRRPYIHPIAIPEGTGILSAGIYTGFRDINGIDYLSASHASDATADVRIGTFHPLLMGPQRLDDHNALWSVITQWRGPDGTPVLGESQRWTFTDHGDSYDLDLLWTLSANTDLTFGAPSEGGPFLRTAWGGPACGTFLNSEGRSGPDANGQPANWMLVSGIAIDDRHADTAASIQMMNQPKNAGQPVPWWVDENTGAGPVPLGGVAGLAAGEMVAFRYRFHVKTGQVSIADGEEEWQRFLRETDADDADRRETREP